MSLFQVVRDRLLSSPQRFPRRDVEAAVPRDVFYDRVLCVDQPLTDPVIRWLVNDGDQTPLPGVRTLNLGPGVLIDAVLARLCVLFGDAHRLLLRDRWWSGTLSLPRLEHVELVNVAICCYPRVLAGSRLTSLSVKYDLSSENGDYSHTFVGTFSYRIDVFRHLTHWTFHDCPQGSSRSDFDAVRLRAQYMTLFENLAYSNEEMRLESVDLFLADLNDCILCLVGEFLSWKCAATLRSLKTDFLVPDGWGAFPVLHRLENRHHALNETHACSAARLAQTTAACPRLSKVALDARIMTHASALEFADKNNWTLRREQERGRFVFTKAHQ